MGPENYRSWVRRVHVAEAREWFSREGSAMDLEDAVRYTLNGQVATGT